jgi:hypothetical protein
VSDPLELVAAVNPVRGSLALEPAVRARIETAVLRADHGPAPRRLRLPRVAVIAMAVVAAGSAAAALGVLAAQPSAPPSGTFPGRVVSSNGYSLNITPNVQAGSVGWCVTLITFYVHGGGGGTGCSPAPTSARPLVALGGTGTLHGHGATTTFVGTTAFITTAAVAAVRVSPKLTILTRGDRQLPRAYRVAIVLTRRVVAARRSQSVVARVDNQLQAAVALDRAGTQIGPPAGSQLSGRPHAPSIKWGGGPGTSKTAPAAKCEISLPGSRAMFGHVIRALRGFPQAQAGTFLSCASATLSYHGGNVLAAVLLDARRPGATPKLPRDAVPLAGHPGIYVASAVKPPRKARREVSFSPAPIYFRRVPGALVVLEAGNPLQITAAAFGPYSGALLARVRACVHLRGALCRAPA